MSARMLIGIGVTAVVSFAAAMLLDNTIMGWLTGWWGGTLASGLVRSIPKRSEEAL